jgi:hypothetical protein
MEPYHSMLSELVATTYTLMPSVATAGESARAGLLVNHKKIQHVPKKSGAN